MQASIDTTAVDRGPIVDNKIEIALFYIFFVVVFSFFFINIFVALIILTFQEQGEKDQGDCELDRNQVKRMRDKHVCVMKGMRDNINAWFTLDLVYPQERNSPICSCNLFNIMVKYWDVWERMIRRAGPSHPRKLFQFYF